MTTADLTATPQLAPLRLGTHEVWPPVVLAPMAGVTNAPFRTLCRRFGPGLVYVNEMVMATGIVHGSRKTDTMLTFSSDESFRSLQLYGSDPGRRDSDRDGVPDGDEDADHDGVTNGREQDRRPVPVGLEPTLAKAPTAWPWARDACQTPDGAARIRPCRFGDRKGDMTIVLFGDSHATQWLPALSMTGKREGWRIVLITKTACPSVDVLPQGQRDLDDGRSCTA